MQQTLVQHYVFMITTMYHVVSIMARSYEWQTIFPLYYTDISSVTPDKVYTQKDVVIIEI